MHDVKKKESWKIFDQIFSSYDQINQILSFGMDRRWRDQVAQKIAKEKPCSLLDLASGTADQLIAILKKNPSLLSATALDLSEKMLEKAKEKIKKLDTSSQVSFIHADACNIPFEENSFDAISFSFGIRNVENPSTSLQEIYRVLKNEGKVYILEFSLPKPWIRPFYLFYLRHFLPFIGGILSKNLKAYRYLNQTIETFPYGKDFLHLMEKEGFQNLETISFSLGAVTLYIGQKKE